MKTAAIYARVSSDRQKEEQTIASQTSALRGYATEHEYVVPDLLPLRRRGLERRHAGAAGPRAPAGRRRPGSGRGRARVQPRSAQSQVCVSGPAARRIRAPRCPRRLPARPPGRHPRGRPAPAIPGHDRRVRESADQRAHAPGEAASGPSRRRERAHGRALRVSLCPEI